MNAIKTTISKIQSQWLWKKHNFSQEEMEEKIGGERHRKTEYETKSGMDYTILSLDFDNKIGNALRFPYLAVFI